MLDTYAYVHFGNDKNVASCARKKNTVVHSYQHGFTGFAARLSALEAQQLAKHPGVVSVFPDPIFQLHTTRSWDFLLYETSLLIDSYPHSNPDLPLQGSDAIIGILDTGDSILI